MVRRTKARMAMNAARKAVLPMARVTCRPHLPRRKTKHRRQQPLDFLSVVTLMTGRMPAGRMSGS